MVVFMQEYSRAACSVRTSWDREHRHAYPATAESRAAFSEQNPPTSRRLFLSSAFAIKKEKLPSKAILAKLHASAPDNELLHGVREGELVKGVGIQAFAQVLWYGQSTWQNKDDCWGIQNHVCDLTNETSDIQEPYYGRVKAASAGVYSDWSLSCRFTPWRETMIGPPTVTVIHSNKSITLKLQAPRSPYKRKRGSKIPMTNYYDLLYQVFIINNLLDEVSYQLKLEMTLEVKSYHFTKGRYSPKGEKTGVGVKTAIPYDNIT
ncbi:Il22ra2 [Columba livia]|nr:Il22ra2 [Columba livia]